jgi:subtilase family serine protease
MHSKVLLSLLAVTALIAAATPQLFAQGQGPAHASIVIPATTVEHPEDVGVRAHTNHLILVRPNFVGTSPSGETPSSIRSVYALSSNVDSGGSQTIAIVDAFNYPTAANDLKVFSTQFGLPPMPDCSTTNNVGPCFSVVFASGSQPRNNCGWAQEAALDIEWSHAMAPNARIVLVEAASNSFTNLFSAVDVATSQVTSFGTGKGEVSMSWGGSEFSSESGDDSHFTNSTVVYTASSGDTGGANIYPSVSPDVVSAGGTTINRDRNGNFVSETGWSGSGGGPSKYESKPSYQNGIANTSTTQRSAPDFSFDADPNSGVSVYDSTRCQGLSGWLVFGGTSVSAPSLAGIINSANHFYLGSFAELSTIYVNYKNTSDFRDITSGTAGSFSAGPGYDFVTGVGSDQGLSGK